MIRNTMTTENNAHTVTCQMLIRKPAKVVFEAIIDPRITTNFWFTKSSGRLETGKTVTWEWEMYNASAEVRVGEIIQNRRIAMEWGDPSTTVVFELEAYTPEQTYVVIRHFGFHETGDALIAALKDSTGGFTSLLDGMKAYLEHGIKLNLTGDKYVQKPE
ncbi:MAG: SRPBCC family protein [Marinoscillum sp.]|uniref:SRPBCC family protein n=1 Tax=Marinoscillum sp. TaxID=2024838 RepID=UPI0033025C21